MSVISAMVEQYRAAKAAGNKRPSTLRNYKQVLDRFVAFCEYEPLTVQLVRAYISHLFDQGMADSSVRCHRTIIVQMLRWAHREGLLPEPIIVDQVSVDRRDPRCLRADEAMRLLKAARLGTRTALARVRDPALIAVLLDTGVRRTELVNFRLADLYLDRQMMRVGAESKGRRERLVPLSEHTVPLLRAYLRERVKWRPASPWLWVGVAGDHLGDERLYQIVRRVARNAGLKGVRVHTLRHSAATLMLKAGVDVYVLSRILGHQQVTTTERYLHLASDDIIDQVRGKSVVDRLAG